MQICPIVYDFSLLHITYFPLHIHISTFIWLYMFYQLIKKTQIEKKTFYYISCDYPFHVSFYSNLLVYETTCHTISTTFRNWLEHTLLLKNMNHPLPVEYFFSVPILLSCYMYIISLTIFTITFLLTSLYPIQLHKNSPSYRLPVTILSFICNYPIYYL